MDNIWDTLNRLERGWNGYAAESPSKLAIVRSKEFVDFLLKEGYTPTRIAASVVGGVAVIRRRGNRKVYVEFFNKGKILAMFSDGQTEPIIHSVSFDERSFHFLLLEMKEYLGNDLHR